jgi:uncharacterized membrane protein YgcG
MGGQTVALQTYLIHFRDRQLALAIGAELEDRLARDGRPAVALVPAGDTLGLTRAAPQVVALYEEGLLSRLESLGLTAYVGVCPEEEAGVVRWAHGGAMLLPVATARDLVDAVADHTPWRASAASMTQFASSTLRFAGAPGPARPALSRKLAVAGIAGPLLLTGLPAAAAATSGPATHESSAKAGVTAVFASKIKPPAKTTPPSVPASIQALINELKTALQNYLQQTGQTGSTNAQALQNQITQLFNNLINSLPKASPQPAQAAQPAQSAPAAQSGQAAQPAQTAAASPSNASTQTPGSSASQSPQNQSQQNPPNNSQQNQDPNQQGQDPNQQGQDPNQQGQDPNQQGQDPNQSQNSTTSPNSSTSQSSTSNSGMGTTASGSNSTSQGGGTTSSGGGTSSGGSTS